MYKSKDLSHLQQSTSDSNQAYLRDIITIRAAGDRSDQTYARSHNKCRGQSCPVCSTLAKFAKQSDQADEHYYQAYRDECVQKSQYEDLILAIRWDIISKYRRGWSGTLTCID